jgi:hypothetical protein
MIKCAFSGNQREVRPMNASIIEHFAILEDPRIERHKKHKLVDIIVLAICAVLSGAEGCSCFTNWNAYMLIYSIAMTQLIVLVRNYGQVYGFFGIDINLPKIHLHIESTA